MMKTLTELSSAVNQKCFRLLNLLFHFRFFPRQKNTLLILKLDAIGDYILFRNYLQSISQSELYKNHHIVLCGSEIYKDIAEHFDNEFVDEFIWINHKVKFNFWYCLRLYIRVQKMGFETVLNPVFSSDNWADLLVRITNAKVRIGFEGDLTNSNWKEKQKNRNCYTQLIANETEHLFEFYRNRQFFSKVLEVECKMPIRPELIVSKGLVRQDAIVICPGSGQPHKIWPAEKFTALILRLGQEFKPEKIFICGGNGDKATGALIASQLKGNLPYLTDLTGKTTLVELTERIATARLVICNDSSAFHIAVALNVPVVCISNGENYGRFSPYPAALSANSKVVYPDELDATKDETVRLQKYCRTIKEIGIEKIEINKVLSQVTPFLSHAPNA